MSTPPVSTKPDIRTPDSAAERQRALPAPPVDRVPSDRAVAADVLIDVPHLTVDELTLELEASLLLNHVKLDAKGLEAGLYLRADLERVMELMGKDPVERGADRTGPRPGLRELLGGTGDAEPAARDHNGNGSGLHATRDRALHAAKQGAKAAGLTAAGLAGGAVLESQLKPSRKLPIPRRRNRTQAVRDAISKWLP